MPLVALWLQLIAIVASAEVESNLNKKNTTNETTHDRGNNEHQDANGQNISSNKQKRECENCEWERHQSQEHIHDSKNN